MTGDRQSLLVQLVVTYEDGQVQTIVTSRYVGSILIRACVYGFSSRARYMMPEKKRLKGWMKVDMMIGLDGKAGALAGGPRRRLGGGTMPKVDDYSNSNGGSNTVRR